MPATAGRVRMPANNRVHSSAALQTHGIWQSAIGYDPYAPSRPDNGFGSGSDSAYASFQGLLALARLSTGSGASETRGACRKCGRVGHLTYQCRNFLTQENYDPALPLEETIRKSGGAHEEGAEEEESSSSDTDVDPEIERIIKKRYGWSFSKRVSVDYFDDDDEKRKRRKHRRRRRRRRRGREDASSSSEEGSDVDLNERKRERRKRREDEVYSSSETGSDEDRKRRKRSRHHRKKD